MSDVFYETMTEKFLNENRKLIPEYIRYAADIWGDIWSMRPCYVWKKLSLILNSCGYYVVTLYKNNASQQFLVADLVLLTFVGPKPEGLYSLHFPDKTKINNELKNLRYGTQKENYADSVKHGTNTVGERSGKNQLTNGKVIQIRKEYDETDISLAALGRKYGVTRENIWHIVNYNTWKHLP